MEATDRVITYFKSTIKGKKTYQPTTLYMGKLSFKNGDIKAFTENKKNRELVTGRPAVQEMLKGVLHAEMKGL